MRPMNCCAKAQAYLAAKGCHAGDYYRYPSYILGFFEYIKGKKTDNTLKSHIETALTCADNAVQYEQEGKLKDAAEWRRKIFGDEFPCVEDKRDDGSDGTRTFSNPSRPYFGY